MSHLAGMLVCAALISVVFASVSKATGKERVAFAVRYFALFMAISVLLGWLMYPFSH